MTTTLETIARAMCHAYGIEPHAASLGGDMKTRTAVANRMIELRAAINFMMEPTEERPDLWEIACCAWCNYPDIEVFRRGHGAMPEGSKEGWDRVFKAVRQAMLQHILDEK